MLEEGVGVGVSVLDEEDADETMALVVETAVDEELTDEMVEVAGTRVSIAKPRQDQQSFGSAHLRPTIDAITAACAVVLVLEVAMPGTLTTHVTGGYTLSVICTCFVAALKAVGTHVGEIATVIIGIALQGKSTTISTSVCATIILGAGVACRTARGASRVAWRRSSPGENRCADHIFTGNVSNLSTVSDWFLTWVAQTSRCSSYNSFDRRS